MTVSLLFGTPQAASANIPSSPGCLYEIKGTWGDDECWMGINWLRYGYNIAGLQFILSAKGFTPGTVDCAFGLNTSAATKRMQRSNGITSDGIVGPNTYKKARAYVVWSGITNDRGSFYNVGLDGLRFQLYTNIWLVKSNKFARYYAMQIMMSGRACEV